MKKTMLSIKYRFCTVEDFLELAEAGAGASSWCLVETAKEAGLMHLADLKGAGIAAEASRLIVFSGSAEYRMEKAFREQQGRVRIVELGTAQGRECRVREQEYLLRKDAGAKGRLLSREFFCQDENGMLKLYCECLAGIMEV
ncbi:MAG: hypothetical protein IKJ34_07430 [Mailhella sp.]|nr:hypothetical protein [Mailhella sp.]